mmetsp:Transcript_10263/g.20650  ORF Transcript_10263/g.20650 Transcript_10263/m.20650 type:complete len:207 (+) Transcript_10263:1438-2058(+)
MLLPMITLTLTTTVRCFLTTFAYHQVTDAAAVRATHLVFSKFGKSSFQAVCSDTNITTASIFKILLQGFSCVKNWLQLVLLRLQPGKYRRFLVEVFHISVKINGCIFWLSEPTTIAFEIIAPVFSTFRELAFLEQPLPNEERVHGLIKQNGSLQRLARGFGCGTAGFEADQHGGPDRIFRKDRVLGFLYKLREKLRRIVPLSDFQH